MTLNHHLITIQVTVVARMKNQMILRIQVRVVLAHLLQANQILKVNQKKIHLLKRKEIEMKTNSFNKN